MAKAQGNVIDISKVIANPVLFGRTDREPWIGMVPSKKINQYLVPDAEKREVLKKLVESFEKDVNEFRIINENGPSALLLPNFREENQRDRLDRVTELIKQKITQIRTLINAPDNGIDLELFLVMLCQEYEEFLKNNPEEFKYMNKTSIEALKDFYKTVNARPIVFREIHVESANEYRVVAFLTGEQERNLNRGNRNSEKLVGLVKGFAGKDNISATEGQMILESIFETITLLDFAIFIKDKKYAKLAFSAILKNYLLKVGFTNDEIQTMQTEEIRETVFQTYDTTGKKHHKGLVTKAIKEGLYFCDFDVLMLLVAARHLNVYEEMQEGRIINLENANTEGVIQEENTEFESNETIIDSVSQNEDAIKVGTKYEITSDDIISRMALTENLIHEILKQRLIPSSTRVSLIVYNSEYVEFSKRKIEEMMTKFCDGVYLTFVMQKNLIYKAFFNPGEMSKWSPELVKRIVFEDRDLVVLALSDLNNLKILYENGKLSISKIAAIVEVVCDGSIFEILEEMKDMSGREDDAIRMSNNASSLLKYLVAEGMLTISDLKLCYDKRIIKMKDLEELEKDKSPEEKNAFAVELGNQIDYLEFLRIYKDYIEHKLRYEKALKENHPDVDIFKDTLEVKRREKDAQVLLFSKYKLANLTEKERKDFMDEFLLTYCLDFEFDDDTIVPETLRQMYKDGIVKFEEISSISNEYLQTVIIDLMFVRGELSLDDTRKLRSILSLEALVAIVNAAMINDSITQTEKVSLIMNIFHNGIEDQEIADKFLSQLHAENYQGINYKDLIKDKKTKENDDEIDGDVIIPPKDPSKEWVYPKFVKWEFLSALDKDAMVTVYANGYVEAYSRKLGVRIIEKYFEVDKEGNRFGRDAYGHATFILDENTYIENFDMLVDRYSGTEPLLNTRTLSALVTNKSDRIRHNTHSTNKNWMRSMVKRFGIDLETDLDLVNDSRYSKEELAHLKEIITRYENTYIDRNEER